MTELFMEKAEFNCCFPGTAVCVPLENTVECIVPDALPDVLEILRCVCTVTECAKSADGDRVRVNATAEACVLYRSEEGTREVLRLSVPMQAQAEGCADGRYTAEICLRRTECTAPNSRKVSVRIFGELCVRPFRQEMVVLPVAVPGTEGMELDIREVSGACIRDITQREFSFTEELELSASAPEATAVLGISAAARDVDCRLIPGTAVVKAVIDYRLWYLAAGGVRDALFSMPFSQILELPAAEDGDNARISVSVSALSLREEEAGRIWSVTVSGSVHAAVFGTCSVGVITDAYSTCDAVTAERGTCCLWKAGESAVREREFREALECGGRVVSAAAEPLGILRGDGKLTAEIAVILLADNGEGTVPVTHRVSAEFPMEGELLFPEIAVTEVTFVPTSAGAEVRGRICLHGTEVCEQQVPAVVKLCSEGPRAEEHIPSVTLRRVAAGERYFDICRAYSAPRSELFAANGLEPSDRVEEARMLIIPRK
ncbi:MAG: DUF3794 domain-containing protein [Clostridia bacterium]|nr:DUF3794 domain-containing protein [Clostridia bacterium]